MTRLKVRENKITLTGAIRDALKVDANDYVEAEVVSGGVLLKPAARSGEELWREIQEAQAQVRYIGPNPPPTEEEVLQMAVDEVKAIRRAKASRRS